jgi:hypothetical protein
VRLTKTYEAPVDAAPGGRRALVPWIPFRSAVAPDLGLKPDPRARDLPARFNDLPLLRARLSGARWVLTFGKHYGSATVVAVLDANREVVSILDFSSYVSAPLAKRSDEQDTNTHSVTWADAVDDVLYVEHAHAWRPSSEGDKDAYVTAVDLHSGELLWRSAPLVANQDTFALGTAHVYCGYGIDPGPIALFALDRFTGDIVARVPLKTFPRVVTFVNDALVVGYPIPVLAPVMATSEVKLTATFDGALP